MKQYIYLLLVLMFLSTVTSENISNITLDLNISINYTNSSNVSNYINGSSVSNVINFSNMTIIPSEIVEDWINKSAGDLNAMNKSWTFNISKSENKTVSDFFNVSMKNDLSDEEAKVILKVMFVIAISILLFFFCSLILLLGIRRLKKEITIPDVEPKNTEYLPKERDDEFNKIMLELEDDLNEKNKH